MMEDAQSLEAIRHSCLRRRETAGMTHKNNVQQQQECNAGRKRGRRGGTANRALGKCFTPVVGTLYNHPNFLYRQDSQ